MAVLKLGDRGPAVDEVTDLLVARGYLTTAPALFDRRMKMAVKEFQARHVDQRGQPLDADGKVGALTLWALRNPDNSDILNRPVDEHWFTLPPGGSPTGRAALAAAIEEMRLGASEVGANNSGPWVEKYLNGIVDTPANWCAGFASWCFSQTPDGIPYRYSLGARDTRMQFKKKGWTYDPAVTTPEPGDIIVWWREQPDSWKGHIGLVHHVEGGILYTIEGNKGGFPAPVQVFDYVLGRIDKLLGFGRVPD